MGTIPWKGADGPPRFGPWLAIGKLCAEMPVGTTVHWAWGQEMLITPAVKRRLQEAVAMEEAERGIGEGDA